MYKISLIRNLHQRNSETELQFRLRDEPGVNLIYHTGVLVKMGDLAAFTLNGELTASNVDVSDELKMMVARCREAMGVAYTAMTQDGAVITEAAFQAAVGELLRKDAGEEDAEPEQALVERFRLYVEEEHRGEAMSEHMYKECLTLSRKLERFLAVKEMEGLVSSAFTTELLTEFEKFCVDEYLYAANPKYAHLYPRAYSDCRFWPKQRLKEEPLRKVLIHFQNFWRDMVSYGELEASPYDAYVPWMQEKKRKRYYELMGEPLSLSMDEFEKVITTPVPESMASTRNAFILQCCLGCKCEDFRNLSMANIGVSKEGIPYIIYKHKAVRTKERVEYTYDIRIPLVRIAFDIVMRQRFDFFFGVYNAAYNRKLQLFLRHCGITREVCVRNARTEETECVPFCDVICQSNIHQMHMDLLYESDGLRGLRGGWYNGAKKQNRYSQMLVADYFKKLNQAFSQMPFKVDQNLNIISGSPFQETDPYVYEEQPDKLPGGRTNPYVIAELIPLPFGVGPVSERVEVRYGCTLSEARKVVVCGNRFLDFMAGIKESHQEAIRYGLLLLKMLPDFNVTFVKDLSDTIYELRTWDQGYVYLTYFYLNGDTIVLMDCHLDEKYKKHKAADRGLLKRCKEMRWNHVLGKVQSKDYDQVLDAQFGEPGSIRREVFEMRACCGYASQTIRYARVSAGLKVEDVAQRLGLNYKVTRLSHVEDGYKVLPYKYLTRIMNALGLKAILTRPSLPGWNAYSRTHTLEQMLTEIGEPVYRWMRKEPEEQ